MSTKIHGRSDDLIEFEGDVYGEVGSDGALLHFSDGTLLDVKYGKSDLGIWSIVVLRTGELFDRIDECSDEDANPHSDVAHFHDGLKWAYASHKWERVA